jgi:DNA-binding IclR family transcriptional regulator
MAVRSLSSALKIFSLCDVIATSPKPLRLSDLATITGEARGTVYQRLKTLTEAGWLEQTEDSTFRLSLRFQIYASAALEQANLGVRVGDLLHQMVNESGETASLSILDSNASVIVRRAETQHLLRADLRVGTRLSLATTATGIILVAFARPAHVDKMMAEGVELPTPEVVANARTSGYATNADSHHRDVAAIAAPVLDGAGHAIAAVSLSGPTSRFDFERCTAIVLHAAQQISTQMGGGD